MKILTKKQRDKIIKGIIELEVENFILRMKLISLNNIKDREESIEQGIIKSFQEQF